MKFFPLRSVLLVRQLALLFYFIFGIFCRGNAQKPIIDTEGIKGWNKVEFGKISDDGKYVSYQINPVYGSEARGKHIVVRAVNGKWEKEFYSASSGAFFSPDSKQFFVMLSQDTLAILNNGDHRISYITDVFSFRVTSRYLIYNLKSSSSTYRFLPHSGGDPFYFDNVNSYELNEDKNVIILVRNGQDNISLTYINLTNKSQTVFWKGKEASSFLFDQTGRTLGFIGKGEGEGIRGIYLYNLNEYKVQLLIDERAAGVDSNLTINRLYRFTYDGEQLYYVVNEKPSLPKPAMAENAAKVTIWSYADAKLKSQIEIEGRRAPDYFFSININSKKIISISGKNDRILDFNKEIVIIWHGMGAGDPEESDWNPSSQKKTLIFQLKDGTEKEAPAENVFCSKEERFLIYYNRSDNNYYTYELSTGKSRNITGKIVDDTLRSRFYKYEFNPTWAYSCYWINHDSSVIVFANRDIWELDPLGERAPINITNGYGAKHDVFFNPVEELSSFSFKKGALLTLVGFNYSTKQNGFYRIKWNKLENPEVLDMNEKVYYTPHLGIENGYDNKPLKAGKANVWLIKRMSEKESPNYFVTSNFKYFHPISNIYPEKKYNWLTTELHTWKSFSGDSIQGILYKPENFDPNKKYPIIFHYYEHFSNNLHAYLDPETFIGPINIPYIVSRDYLVFVPDIIYKPGETARSAYNSVVSAAEYMEKMPYVDSSKMGIQGHSFGGFETNYIITQTGMFAAACSSSGITDLIGFSGGVSAVGKSMHWMTSKGQIRLNVKLWKDTQRYMNNSPLFYLDNVTTPLLVMHTTDDTAVPFVQAMELFNGLRQFRKKVWLLIYQGENHILRDENNSYDYTMRQLQFFDYYLKGKEMPSWMKVAE